VADPSDQLEDARAFALDYCTRHGDPEAAARLRIELPERRVVFSIIDAASCGSSISGFLRADRQEATLAEALSRIMRQRARDRALKLSREDGTPAWSIDIHALAWTILRNAGVNPLLLAFHGDRTADGRSGFDRAVDVSPISVEAEIRAGRVSISALSVRSGRGIDDRLVYSEGLSPPRLILLGQTIPDTAGAALVGRPLGELVDHPLLENADEVCVVRTVNDDGNLEIELKDERRTLAPPPHDADWLHFAWHP
jgi:hypothetical protein